MSSLSAKTLSTILSVAPIQDGAIDNTDLGFVEATSNTIELVENQLEPDTTKHSTTLKLDSLEGPTQKATYEQATEILGKENFLGPDKVNEALKTHGFEIHFMDKDQEHPEINATPEQLEEWKQYCERHTQGGASPMIIYNPAYIKNTETGVVYPFSEEFLAEISTDFNNFSPFSYNPLNSDEIINFPLDTSPGSGEFSYMLGGALIGSEHQTLNEQKEHIGQTFGPNAFIPTTGNIVKQINLYHLTTGEYLYNQDSRLYIRTINNDENCERCTETDSSRAQSTLLSIDIDLAATPANLFRLIFNPEAVVKNTRLTAYTYGIESKGVNMYQDGKHVATSVGFTIPVAPRTKK